MKLVAFVFLFILSCLTIIVDKTVNAISLTELRRRARSGGNKNLAKIYRLAAYESSLSVLLWVIGVISASAVVIFAAQQSWWLVVVVILALAWLGFVWQAPKKASGATWSMAAVAAPLFSFLLGHLQPLLVRVGGKKSRKEIHSGIYEKQDLLDFINKLSTESDNRLSEHDLRAVFGALSFGDKKVSAIMEPLSKLKLVGSGDSIGPKLMDELHKSGSRRFLVAKDIKSSKPEIVGILYLNDLVDYKASGRVSSVMDRKVHFISEDQNLHEALADFTDKHTFMLVVANNFDEVVGALSFEDLLKEITGRQLKTEPEPTDDKQSEVEVIE